MQSNELFVQADDLYRRGSYQSAHDTYQKALEIDSSNQVGRFNFGMLKLLLGNIEGDRVVREAILAQPNAGSLDIAQAIQAVVQQEVYMGYKLHASRWLAHARDNKIELPDEQRLSRTLDFPGYLDPVRKDPITGQVWQRYAPFESNRYVYAIETVGGCNLRCPTCPVGQRSHESLSNRGLMSVELFTEIIKKIQADDQIRDPDIWLFNWSEPLLHPRIAEFVEIVSAAGLTSFLSTNLNVTAQLPAVMRAQPTQLKVSLSSFNQEIYGRTHTRGQISRVIKNLEELADLRDKQTHKTRIWIGHHLYKDTLGEADTIRDHVKSLGFEYHPSYAIIAPIEVVADLIQHPSHATKHDILERLVFNPIETAKQNRLRRSGNMDCEMRFNMTAIDFDGSVMLCCGTNKSLRDTLKTNFLQTSRQRIEDLKYANPFCKACIDHGLSLTVSDI